MQNRRLSFVGMGVRMSVKSVFLLAGVLLLIGLPAWPGQAQTNPLKLESPAFAQGQPIPRQYSCEGADVSPPLRWSDPPQGVKSLALIFDDPDAPVGDWVHWVIYNLPAATRSLPEAVPKTESAAGGLQGRSSFKKIGYGGPCPPSGTHHYFFRLYALDTPLSLPPGAEKKDVEAAMQSHIVGKAELMGTYQRGK